MLRRQVKLKRSYLQWSSSKGWGSGSLLKRSSGARAEGESGGRAEAGHFGLLVALRSPVVRYGTDFVRVPCLDACPP